NMGHPAHGPPRTEPRPDPPATTRPRPAIRVGALAACRTLRSATEAVRGGQACGCRAARREREAGSLGRHRSTAPGNARRGATNIATGIRRSVGLLGALALIALERFGLFEKFFRGGLGSLLGWRLRLSEHRLAPSEPLRLLRAPRHVDGDGHGDFGMQ